MIYCSIFEAFSARELEEKINCFLQADDTPFQVISMTQNIYKDFDDVNKFMANIIWKQLDD